MLFYAVSTRLQRCFHAVFTVPEGLLLSHGWMPQVALFGEHNADYGRIPNDYKVIVKSGKYLDLEKS